MIKSLCLDGWKIVKLDIEFLSLTSLKVNHKFRRPSVGSVIVEGQTNFCILFYSHHTL